MFCRIMCRWLSARHFRVVPSSLGCLHECLCMLLYLQHVAQPTMSQQEGRERAHSTGSGTCAQTSQAPCLQRRILHDVISHCSSPFQRLFQRHFLARLLPRHPALRSDGNPVIMIVMCRTLMPYHSHLWTARRIAHPNPESRGTGCVVRSTAWTSRKARRPHCSLRWNPVSAVAQAHSSVVLVINAMAQMSGTSAPCRPAAEMSTHPGAVTTKAHWPAAVAASVVRCPVPTHGAHQGGLAPEAPGVEALGVALAVAAEPLQVVQLLLFHAGELQNLFDADHSGESQHTLWKYRSTTDWERLRACERSRLTQSPMNTLQALTTNGASSSARRRQHAATPAKCQHAVRRASYHTSLLVALYMPTIADLQIKCRSCMSMMLRYKI